MACVGLHAFGIVSIFLQKVSTSIWQLMLALVTITKTIIKQRECFMIKFTQIAALILFVTVNAKAGAPDYGIIENRTDAAAIQEYRDLYNKLDASKPVYFTFKTFFTEIYNAETYTRNEKITEERKRCDEILRRNGITAEYNNCMVYGVIIPLGEGPSFRCTEGTKAYGAAGSIFRKGTIFGGKDCSYEENEFKERKLPATAFGWANLTHDFPDLIDLDMMEVMYYMFHEGAELHKTLTDWSVKKTDVRDYINPVMGRFDITDPKDAQLLEDFKDPDLNEALYQSISFHKTMALIPEFFRQGDKTVSRTVLETVASIINVVKDHEPKSKRNMKSFAKKIRKVFRKGEQSVLSYMSTRLEEIQAANLEERAKK